MPNEFEVPKNLYFVQTSLPWFFHACSKNHAPLNEVMTADKYPKGFKAVYKAMRASMSTTDTRGTPEPLTLEEANARLELGRDATQAIMVAVTFVRVPENTWIRVDATKSMISISSGTLTAFRLDIDWKMNILLQTGTLAERIRGTLAMRDPTAVVMLYSIWDTQQTSAAGVEAWRRTPGTSGSSSSGAPSVGDEEN